MTTLRHPVALSFAAAQRPYARQVRDALLDLDIKPFYDDDFSTEMWGKSHARELPRHYQDSHVVIVFISHDHVARDWPRHEATAILSEMVRRDEGYVLPVRFDDVTLDGLDSSVHYFDGTVVSPADVARAVEEKLVSMGVKEARHPTGDPFQGADLRPGSIAAIATSGEVGGQLSRVTDPRAVIATMSPILEVAEDLIVIQNELGVHVPLPSSVSTDERVWLRVLSLLLQGKCPAWPRRTIGATAHEGANIPRDGAFFTAVTSAVIELGVHTIPMPSFGIYHPNVRFEVDDQSRAFSAKPSDGTPFAAYIPTEASAAATETTPWNLTGIDELPTLILPNPRPET